MLEIGSRTIAIDGITVFADHADPNQFWYLPGPVRLARRPEDNRADFTFIKYAGIRDARIEGGGFLTFKVNLHLERRTRQRILARLSTLAPDAPKLAPVPFDEGTVEAVALNVQGPGGTTATLNPDGAFVAVEQILGSAVPSLHGDNDAAFSLTLSQEGAVILEKAFREGGTPVGVLYQLRYTGLRPSLDVEITANMKQVYDHFSAALEAQYAMVGAGIEAGIEKLRNDGAITIKVINFSTAAEQEERISWALDFFKEKLLNEWFTPTLTPGQMKGGPAKAELSTVASRAKQLRPPRRTPEDMKPTRPIPDGGAKAKPSARHGKAEPAGVVGNTSVQEQEEGEGRTPPPGETPADRATVGLSFPAPKVPSAANGVLANQGSGMAGFGASFKLKLIRSSELRTLHLRYSRADAVQRTYAPPGFFGLLTEDLDRSSHFIDVDLDHSFFREFEVRVESPFDAASVGLASTQLLLDYGDPNDPESYRQADLVFDATRPDVQPWLVKSQLGRLDYRHQVQFHFDPQSEWRAARSSYELPAVTTKDRTLLVHPFGHFGFLDVAVHCDEIDWTIVASVDVDLHIDADGWVDERTLHFTAERAGPQHWQLRLENRQANDYRYRVTYRLDDGDTITTDAVEVINGASQIAVPNPFYRLEVEFIPLFDQEAYRMVFVDVEYRDDENDHDQQARLRFPGTGLDSRHAVLHLLDPSKRTFQYQLTFVGVDQQLTREPARSTQSTLIGVGDPLDRQEVDR